MLKPAHIAITGASSGIGAALALHYSEPGIMLFLNGRNASRLEWVATQARAKGASVHTTVGDITDRPFMIKWINAITASRPLDLMIANAGISPGLKTGEETAEDVYAVLNTNITGVINTVQPVIEKMKLSGSGQIALMASLAGFRGLAGAASYCASKAAVRVYGEALRADLLPYGVKVNVICPGFIKTPLTDKNPFPMPLIMSAEHAASQIANGLTKDRPCIAFPWSIYMLVRLVSLLPQDILNRIVGYFRKKSL
jgi:short-subunit dehydrogenase